MSFVPPTWAQKSRPGTRKWPMRKRSPHKDEEKLLKCSDEWVKSHDTTATEWIMWLVFCQRGESC